MARTFRFNPPLYSHCPHGLQIGQAIPGSKFVRDYCWKCGEPIRVSHGGKSQIAGLKLDRINFCEKCDPRPTPVKSTPRMSGDNDPSFDNAVRAMERRGW